MLITFLELPTVSIHIHIHGIVEHAVLLIAGLRISALLEPLLQVIHHHWKSLLFLYDVDLHGHTKFYQSSPFSTPDRSSLSRAQQDLPGENFVMWNGHRPLVPCALPCLRTRWYLLHIRSLILVLALQRKGRFLNQPRRQPHVVDLLVDIVE